MLWELTGKRRFAKRLSLNLLDGQLFLCVFMLWPVQDWCDSKNAVSLFPSLFSLWPAHEVIPKKRCLVRRAKEKRKGKGNLWCWANNQPSAATKWSWTMSCWMPSTEIVRDGLGFLRDWPIHREIRERRNLLWASSLNQESIRLLVFDHTWLVHYLAIISLSFYLCVWPGRTSLCVRSKTAALAD